MVYIAFEKDGMLKGIKIAKCENMTAEFTVEDEYTDCDISVYVWDKSMIPLMEVQHFNH